MNVNAYTVKERELIAFKKRRYVRQITSNAIKCGQLEKADLCDLCKGNEGGIEAHHVDYGKPMNVMWLCSSCHGKAHSSDSPLNPNNNHQSPLPDAVEKYDMITITFSIPVKNFMTIKKIAESKGIPMSQIFREFALEKFPVQSNQLEFDLEDKKHDSTQNVKLEGIQILAENEVLLQQPQRALLQKVWREGDPSMPGMDRQFSEIFGGHGKNASIMQRIGANR